VSLRLSHSHHPRP